MPLTERDHRIAEADHDLTHLTHLTLRRERLHTHRWRSRAYRRTRHGLVVSEFPTRNRKKQRGERGKRSEEAYETERGPHVSPKPTQVPTPIVHETILAGTKQENDEFWRSRLTPQRIRLRLMKVLN